MATDIKSCKMNASQNSDAVGVSENILVMPSSSQSCLESVRKPESVSRIKRGDEGACVRLGANAQQVSEVYVYGVRRMKSPILCLAGESAY